MAFLEEQFGVRLLSPTPDAKTQAWRVTWLPPGGHREQKWFSRNSTTRVGGRTTSRAEKEARDFFRVKVNEIRNGGKTHCLSEAEIRILELSRSLGIRRAEATLQAAIDEKKALQKPRYTVLQAVNRWRDEAEISSLSIETWRQRKAIASRISKTSIGSRYMDSLSRTDVRDWFTEELGHLAWKSRNHTLNSLSHVYDLSWSEWDWTEEGLNPCSKIPRAPKPKKRPPPEIWQPQLLEDVFSFISELPESTASGSYPRYNLEIFLALAAYTGMRPISEIGGVHGNRETNTPPRPGLTWEDIDSEERHIRVPNETKTGWRFIHFTPNPDVAFTKPIADALWSKLEHHVLPYKATGPIVPVSTRKTLTAELKKAGLMDKWPADALRHTWISALGSLDVAKHFVAKQGGNSIDEIERSYEHPMPKKQAMRWLGIKE